jgi:hypothetical protein
MVNVPAGEEIPQGVPVFHSDYEGADHKSVLFWGHRGCVASCGGVVTSADVLTRGHRAAACCKCGPSAIVWGARLREAS